MDWVKPKHRARQMKQSDTSDADVSASAWLKQLCEENVAILQASLPVCEPLSKIKPAKVGGAEYLRATMWGTGVWEVENSSRQEYLNDLVELFGGFAQVSTSKKTRRSKESGNSKPPSSFDSEPPPRRTDQDAIPDPGTVAKVRAGGRTAASHPLHRD